MDVTSIMATAINIRDQLMAFDMPIPDVLWGVPLVLAILWLAMRNHDERSVGSVDAMAREHHRLSRSLRENRRELERERNKTRRRQRRASRVL